MWEFCRMRKVIAEALGPLKPLNLQVLHRLFAAGYKYVQVRGYTADRHYEYIEPAMIILFPMRELPADPEQKDIYEPLDSKLLEQWAVSPDTRMKVMISAMR